jgi:hypothetical protein
MGPRAGDAGTAVPLALARHAIQERRLEILAAAAADAGRIQAQEDAGEKA